MPTSSDSPEFEARLGADLQSFLGEHTPFQAMTDAELAERKTKWAPRATNHTSGALWKYAQQVGPAVDGAVTHPGGAHEKQCYADI